MIQLIVFLYTSDKGIQGLRDYESKVIPILREHGGVLISSSSSSSRVENYPDEIHILQFPSTNHFNAYKDDERIVSIAQEKNKAIRKIEIFQTDQFHEYQ